MNKLVETYNGWQIFTSEGDLFGDLFFLISKVDEHDFMQEPFFSVAAARDKIDELTGKKPPYKIMGVKADGERVQLSENPYPSRGWCFATATKWAVEFGYNGNPDNFVKLELRNVDDEPLDNYNVSDMLIVKGVENGCQSTV